MLTQRDIDAGTAAAKKIGVKFFAGIPDAEVQRIVAAVVLAVDAERSPVAITKDVLANIFAPRHGTP